MYVQPSEVRLPAMSSPSDASTPLDVEELFRAHFDAVYAFIGRSLGPYAPPEDVEDLTQQVFLVAHRQRHRFRGESSPRTWLFAIAYRTVLTHLRSRRRRRALASAIEQELSSLPPVEEASPEGEMHRRRLLAEVWQELSKIRPKKRIAYLMHEVLGLPGSTIAEVVGVPEATVFTRLHHARKELRERLARRGLAL